LYKWFLPTIQQLLKMSTITIISAFVVIALFVVVFLVVLWGDSRHTENDRAVQMSSCHVSKL